MIAAYNKGCMLCHFTIELFYSGILRLINTCDKHEINDDHETGDKHVESDKHDTSDKHVTSDNHNIHQ